jgi:hypothetical protein
VVEKGTEEIVIRSRDGLDCTFDYIVYGLRIGFEETSVVQEKEQEAYIPSMSDHRELYQRRPDLRKYNSLERFKGMRHVVAKSEDLDLSRTHALRDAIIEFDSEVHELPRPPGFEEMAEEDLLGRDEERRRGIQFRGEGGTADPRHDRRPASDHPVLGARIPVDDDGNVYATSFRPSSRDVASLVDVSEAVEPGDVLVIDRDDPGMMRKGSDVHDTGVIGVVAAEAGLMLGTQPPGSTDSEEATQPIHRAAVALAGVVNCKG